MSTIKRRFILTAYIILFFVQFTVTAQKITIKVACIGDSVTTGYLLANSQTESYPSQLQVMMGKNYEVENFGYSGATLLKKGHQPYCKTQQCADAIAFSSDVAIIDLGLNDTDLRNWPNHKEEFDADYSWLLDTLKKQNLSLKIYICQMTNIFSENPRFKSGNRDWYWQIQTHITNIAKLRHSLSKIK